MSTAVAPHAGPVLREWRHRRRLSQLDVSTRTGVSTRHLSYVETGKSKPSRELLLHLAEELEMPQRAINDMLLAAGFAPVFSELDLSDEALAPVRDVIDLVLAGNDPHPTTVIDIRWDLIDANAAALWMTRGVAAEVLAPVPNVARVCLHPEGLAPRIRNLPAFASHLLRHMRQVLFATHDPQLAALIDECESYVPHGRSESAKIADVVLPLEVEVDGYELAFMSTVTAFGTSRDVTLSELSIETLYPADARTRTVLDERPWAA
ncbi:MAG: helix-turn-helix transcriptional regulator [Actinomycetota bacterium]